MMSLIVAMLMMSCNSDDGGTTGGVYYPPAPKTYNDPDYTKASEYGHIGTIKTTTTTYSNVKPLPPSPLRTQ